MTRNIWFCSDWHLWHENIIHYSGRPFSNVKEMTEALVEYHNELVKPEDLVYNLGDVTMLRGNRANRELTVNTVRRFNGRLHLLPGNHDYWGPEVYVDCGFKTILGSGRWLDKCRYLFSHFPVHPASMGKADACVHGHTHAQPDITPVLRVHPKHGEVIVQPYVNLCVERTNYRPVAYEDLVKLVDKAKAKGA